MPTRTRFVLDQEDRDFLTAIGCWICGTTDQPLVPDHDHTIGHLRGFLCRGCNVGLGFFRDNPDRLRKAAAYLEERELVTFGDCCDGCRDHDYHPHAPVHVEPEGDLYCTAFYRCPKGHVWTCSWHVDAWLSIMGIEVKRRVA